MPPTEPSEDLDFQPGEVIYENTQIVEWAKFWNLSALSVYGFLAYWVPYNLVYKTHLPLQSAYDSLFVPQYTQSPFAFDLNGFHVIGFAGVSLYASYIGLVSSVQSTFMKFECRTTSTTSGENYVVKMQYNKDKELLFVTRITPWCGLV